MEKEHVFDQHQSTLRRDLALSRLNGRSFMGTLTPCATVEKNPFKIRAVIKDLYDPAAAHHAVVADATTKNQKKTGNRPKNAAKATTKIPPAPIMNTLPAVEWFTMSSVIDHSLRTSPSACVPSLCTQDALCLRYQGHRPSRAPVVWKECCRRNNKQDEVLLPLRPVERVIRIFRRLWVEELPILGGLG
ncbi:MAG: hypothetical protein Q9179_002276 [Wetmoreana sp. 5 TL-2023]